MAIDQKVTNLVPIAIEQIAFGVRFQPRYEVLDRLGAVMDKILRTKGSPFDTNTFPLSSRDAGEHRLLNTETGDSLRLSESDVILDMRVDTRTTSDIMNLADNFKLFILDNLHDVANLRDINRYGVLLRLKECHANLKETPVNYFISSDFKDARSMSLRFTRRLPILEALARKNVDDYRNVIYTVKQSENGDVKISIDYQEYFDPHLDTKEWIKKPFSDFADRGITYFTGEFQDWLKKLLGKDEAA